MTPIEKGFADAAEFISKISLGAFVIAAFAGLVSYLQRFNGDNPPEWKWLLFVTKVLTAGFVGILCDWLLSGWNIPQTIVHFAIAVAGYGGVETMLFFQQIFQDTIRRAARVSEDDRPKD